MADPEFEGRLDRLFAEAPSLGDSEAFARRVLSRLDRAWTLRRLLIGGLGVAGGLIGVGQVAASGLVGRAAILSTQSAKVFSIAMANHLPAHLFFDYMPMGSDFLWAVGAFLVVGLVLVVMRAIGEL